MTNKPEQMNLSPEGAAIARAVNQTIGVKADVLAIKTRSRDDAGEKKAPAVEAHPQFKWDIAPDSVDELSIPFLHYYRPSEGSVLTDILLGMAERVNLGVADRWSIVGRRNGARLFQLDYDNEPDCEADRDSLRMALDHWITVFGGDASWADIRRVAASQGDGSLAIPLRAYRMEEFDPSTGQTTRAELFRLEPYRDK
jgi:hypothetical protein